MTTKPELPEPVRKDSTYAGGPEPREYFTAYQMRAYGDECEAYGRATAPAVVGDGLAKSLANYDHACAVLNRLLDGLGQLFLDLPDCDGDDVETDVLLGLSMYIGTIKKLAHKENGQ